MTCGVYRIANLVNGKIYIGSSVNIEQRWAVHRSLLFYRKHQNAHLQSAWSLYGPESFVFEVLVEADRSDILEIEQERLDAVPVDLRYNMIETVTDGVSRYWQSQEARAAQSENLRAHWSNSEYRDRQAVARQRTYADPEQKAKLSVAGKAKWKRDGYRAKFKAAIDAPGKKELRSKKAKAC